jgi:hypothetical protein
MATISSWPGVSSAEAQLVTKGAVRWTSEGWRRRQPAIGAGLDRGDDGVGRLAPSAPPPAPLQRLLDAVAGGQPLHLYLPP